MGLGPTLGAIELGVLCSYFLLGVTATQAYIYYTRFPEDDWTLKLLVAFIWVCEVAHSACVAHGLYVYTILDAGNGFQVSGPLPVTFDVAILIGSIVAAFVQGFSAYRVYVLGRKRILLPTIFGIISAVRLIACCSIFGTAIRMPSLTVYVVRFGWLLTAVWTVSAANDIGITATLVYLLYMQRNEIQNKTLPLVDKLIHWTMETGMMTSTWALLTLVFFVTRKPDTESVWIGMYVMQTRVFANSLLVSLNARSALRSMEAPRSSVRCISHSQHGRSANPLGLEQIHFAPNSTADNPIRVTKSTHVSISVV